jgi:multidrug efflux pump
MKWIEACLRNRLIIYVCSVFLCVLGVVCMIRMPLAPFPGMQLNTIVIHVSYPGANAQTVNRQVTSKLIDGLHSLDNIQQMTALSQAGSSTIDLSLYSTRSVDLLQTQLEVIQAISASNLPSVVPQPQVTVERGWSTLVDYLLFSNKISLFHLNPSRIYRAWFDGYATSLDSDQLI